MNNGKTGDSVRKTKAAMLPGDKVSEGKKKASSDRKAILFSPFFVLLFVAYSLSGNECMIR
jgi:hypothetical protein